LSNNKRLQELTDGVHRLGSLERRVWEHLIGRMHIARNANQVFDEQLTVGQRVADRVAAFGGSWLFISAFLAGMFLWMALNVESGRPFDPFPFILLNLILSCLAALQAPVIMMSQNRQAVKDRIDAQHDYEVNLKAELEVVALHEKMDALRQEHLLLREFLEQQSKQLKSIEAKLPPASASEIE
jgi:uncharacterized membrane protein